MALRQSDPETHLMFKMLDLSFAVAMRQCNRACAGKKKLSATNNKHPVVPTQVAQVPKQPTRSEDVSHSDEIGILTDPTDAVLQPPSQPTGPICCRVASACTNSPKVRSIHAAGHMVCQKLSSLGRLGKLCL